MNITFITVKTSFEGIHCYPQAPDEVAYLRQPHRHIFHVEAEIEVFHNDRELEFIMVKHRLENFLGKHSELGRTSCEEIAKAIQAYLKGLYPIPEEIEVPALLQYGLDSTRRTRIVNVRVSEDEENGVYLREV